jgi:hypothetical protein
MNQTRKLKKRIAELEKRQPDKALQQRCNHLEKLLLKERQKADAVSDWGVVDVIGGNGKTIRVSTNGRKIRFLGQNFQLMPIVCDLVPLRTPDNKIPKHRLVES